MPYSISNPLNGLMLTESSRTGSVVDSRCQRCSTCGFLLNKWDFEWDLWRKPLGGPLLSMTIDGFHIASPSFLKRYDDEGFYGLMARPLSCGYYELRPKRYVSLATNDLESGMLFARNPMALRNAVENGGMFTATCIDGPLCPECGQWASTRCYGTNVIAHGQTPIGDLEIVGCSFLHGQKRNRWHELFAGDGVKAAYRRRKINNISLYHQVVYALG